MVEGRAVSKTNSVHDILRSLALAARNVHFPREDQYGNPALGRFLIDNGRLPYASDEVKPWHYRGWLVPYIQMCESHPLIAPRYEYVLRTLDAGKLLDEPLPVISFVGSEQCTKPGMKQIEEMIRIVEHRSMSWNNFREVCEWLGFALGVTTERSNLADDVQEKLYRYFSLEHWLLHPTDYLGQYLAESGHGKRSGFFPTPIHICEAMTRMTFHDAAARDLRAAKTMDCCVGTGRMLLTASNYSMRLYGQDIDPLCCLITKINLALYAPWFYLPDSLFPEVKPAETISEPESDGKTAETAKIEREKVNQTSAPLLFEMSQFEREATRKPKGGKKKFFTTEIEQPSLF